MSEKNEKVIEDIINLTPHSISIIDKVGNYIEIEPSGQIARCEEEVEKFDPLLFRIKEDEDDFFSIPLVEKKLGKCNFSFPPRKDDTIYIVSLPVAQKEKRDDILGVGETIRDEKGVITGCKSLALIL